MTEPLRRIPRLPSLELLARRDHERGCRNEPPWPYLTISHRMIHDTAAARERKRLASSGEPTDD